MITARGLALFLAGGALIGVGFRYGYPQLVVVGSAALAACAGAVGIALWRPRLEVHRFAVPDRVQRGEASIVTLRIRNAGRWRAATLIAHDRCGPAAIPVVLERLRPQHESTVRYPVPTQRRGVFDLGPLQIAQRDPLGLIRTRRAYGEPGRVWIHPKVHPVQAVPAGVARNLDGRVDNVAHGNLTFHALREYVVGDDLRHVHWRTSARVGELMVREHVDTSLPRVVVLLDDRAEVHTEDSFESSAEAAASIVAAGLREGLHVGLHLVSGGSVEGSVGQQVFLDRLAEADLREQADLRVAVERLRQGRLGDTLVHLTGSAAPEQLDPISALRPVYPSLVVGVLGAEESAPAAIAGLLVITAADGEDFAARWDGVRSW